LCSCLAWQQHHARALALALAKQVDEAVHAAQSKDKAEDDPGRAPHPPAKVM
jgi:hypothetical protein